MLSAGNAPFSNSSRCKCRKETNRDAKIVVVVVVVESWKGGAEVLPRFRSKNRNVGFARGHRQPQPPKDFVPSSLHTKNRP